MTEAEYSVGLEIVQEQHPDYPLLRQLEGGYSKTNAVYLRYALKSLNAPVIDANDAVLKKLNKEKSTLFGQRAKLSNGFHECDSDRERANLSNQIQVVQREIGDKIKVIEHFEKTGELPKPTLKYDIPADRYELAKKLASLRASISRYRRKIEDLAVQTDEHSRAKVVEINAKLQDKLQHKSHVEKALKKTGVE